MLPVRVLILALAAEYTLTGSPLQLTLVARSSMSPLTFSDPEQEPHAACKSIGPRGCQ
jgi:hypothetical protein